MIWYVFLYVHDKNYNYKQYLHNSAKNLIYLILPAWGQLVPGICHHSTSSSDSWCCSRHRGCTRTSRPVEVKRSRIHSQSAFVVFTSGKVGCANKDVKTTAVLAADVSEVWLFTSFCLSSIDWKYWFFPSWLSSFFFRYGSIDLYCA